MCPEIMQSHRIFSTISVKTHEFFFKFGGLVFVPIQDTNAIAIPTKPV